MANAEGRQGPDQGLNEEREAERLHAEIYGPSEDKDRNTDDGSAPDGGQGGAASDGGEHPEQEGSPQERLEKLQHKYEVLQGKYNAEIRQYNEQVRQLNEQLSQSQQKVQTLETQLEQLRNGQQEDDDWAQRMKDAGYDPEFVEQLEARNKQMSDKIADLQAQLAAAVGGGQADRSEGTPEGDGQPSGETEEQKAQRIFEERLARLVTAVGGEQAFKKIDDDPQFAQWLDQVDPVDPTGRTRRDVMQEAFHAERITDAAAYFLAFAQGAGGASGYEGGPSKEELEGPAGHGGPDSGSQDDGIRWWKRSEISDFYARAGAGQIPRERADQLEKEIEAAVSAGKVIQA